jgi:hypothetical protein
MQRSTPIIEKAKVQKQFSLGWLDVAKALLIAMITPVLVLIQNSIDAGQFSFHWKPILMTAIGGGVAYLIKNFFTPTQTVIKGEIKNE